MWMAPSTGLGLCLTAPSAGLGLCRMAPSAGLGRHDTV